MSMFPARFSVGLCCAVFALMAAQQRAWAQKSTHSPRPALASTTELAVKVPTPSLPAGGFVSKTIEVPASSSHQDGAHTRSSSLRPYQAIVSDMLTLQHRFPGWATVLDYGYTTGGRLLRMLKLGDPGAPNVPERPMVLILGAIHGDEFLAIEDQLGRLLLERRERSGKLRRFFAAGGIIYIVPVVNPDGYDRDRRTNNRNVDLNRDFPVLGEPEGRLQQLESRALVESIDREIELNQARLRISFDYHCCKTSLLYPWSHGESTLAPDVLAAHERIAQIMQSTIDASYVSGTTFDILGYAARGTSKDYFHARYGALSFTFEGHPHEEATKLARHVAFWESALDTLVE